ncbi:TPA: triphosphoribosyl-dephospho-CoA synthase CitG [Providencia rettgeri]|uniref:triphosphoribosyl-dephospho-CoA synthase CitG n=1 Tax=Providencia TaxID=586 RepID=UPI001B9FA8D1|nr:triphosphoribosyl-dephospho-CoA synthase CitG [Providencia sp. PROV141]HBC7428453.1 triphosphoribosyl-dephospho-CoA synthase CitG [Providencia rettgeri]
MSLNNVQGIDVIDHSVSHPSDETHVFWAKNLSQLAYQAMMEEVLLTPKPGLVDMRNNGSHQDMDSYMFARSARTVANHLPEFVYLGYFQGKQPAVQTLYALREHGLACEKAMYQVTNNVNTHKGAIFSFGLVFAAMGRLLARNTNITANSICQEVANICQNMVVRELEPIKEATTAGEQFYQLYGLTGARGEAESGFATVLKYGLPTYQKFHAMGWDNERALHQTLLTLMAYNDDTNLVSRGGLDGLHFAQNAAMALLNSDNMDYAQLKMQLILLDNTFITKNLSPGGSADLLAITWFLAHLPKPVKNNLPNSSSNSCQYY